MDKKTKFFVTFLIFLLGIAVVQYLGKVAMDHTTFSWYDSLAKPSFTPEKGIFPLVWSLLYFLMALAGALLYCKPRSHNRKYALIFWGAQLFFNVLWSFCFFTFQNPTLALVDMCLIWICLGVCVFYSYQVSLAAGWYMILNILWVTFALVLNATIVALN